MERVMQRRGESVFVWEDSENDVAFKLRFVALIHHV